MRSAISSKSRQYVKVLASFCLVFGLATLFQVPWLFELGAYDQYTASILEDGDFNLINQKRDSPMGWMVTPTGNDADMTLPGVSVYLAPFFAYRYAQDLVAGAASGRDVLRFMNVHVLSTVFYVLCAMVILWRILERFRVPHFRKATALAATSTPFVYHFFLTSTNNNIFGLAYSIFALGLYALLREKREIPALQMGILGLALGLGLNIRQQLFWIGLLPIALLLEGRRLKIRTLAAFALGAALPLGLMSANNFYRYGTIRVFFMEATNSSLWSISPELFRESLSYLLVGPNGYLFVSPIYLAAALGLLSGVLRKHPLGFAPWIAVLAPIFLILSQAATGFLPDGLGGRHFTEYFFILVLVVAAAFQALENLSKRHVTAGLAVCGALAAWHLLAMASYYGRELWDWGLRHQLSLTNASDGIGLILGGITWDRLLKSLKVVVSHLPLILPLSVAILALLRAPVPHLARALSGFFVIGALTLAIFTTVNVVNHDRNVASMRLSGFYDQRVVGKSGRTVLYDSAIESFRLTGAYYAATGRCDLASETLRRFRGYLVSVRADVEADPIGFVSDLNRGVIRRSAFEEPDSTRVLDSYLLENCALSLR